MNADLKLTDQELDIHCESCRTLKDAIPRETWDADGWGVREKQLI